MRNSEKFISYIKNLRNHTEDGILNRIPIAECLPYAKHMIVKSREYVVITGATKAGKTQLMSHFFLFNVLMYAYSNRDKYKVHFLYFLLEENIEDVYCRFTSFILKKRFGLRVDYDTLLSSDNENSLSDEALMRIESEEFKDILSFFEDSITFATKSFTSEQIEDALDSYAKKYGNVKLRAKSRDNSIGYVKYEKESYINNNPDIYHIVLFDNFNNIQLSNKERSLNEAISNVSNLFVRGRNIYGFTFVGVIQQLDSETHSLTAVNNGNILATKAGLKDCKQPGNDCTQLWGISNPGEFDQISLFKGYDLNRFRRNYFRVMEIIYCRKRKGKKFFNFFFDGATTTYELLPNYDSKDMEKFYNQVNQLD